VGCVYRDGQSLLEGCDGSVSIGERRPSFYTPVFFEFHQQQIYSFLFWGHFWGHFWGNNCIFITVNLDKTMI
jgi:hypothetical protein